MRIVVVGAGVLGASTAYHLTCAGAEVVLADRADAGRATAAGAGIVAPWPSRVDNPDWYRLAAAGARYYPHLVARLGEDGQGDAGYARVGALSVSTDPAHLDWVERRARQRQAEAPEMGAVSRLAPHEARTLFPPLREDLAAVHIEGAARIDGRLLAAALAGGAQARGARVVHGDARLLASGDRVRGIVIDGAPVEADAVVVATGAWAPALLAPVGVRLAVEPQRGQILHLHLPGVETGAWPVVLPQSRHYMLAFGGSRIVAGATRETGSGFDHRVTAAGQWEVLRETLSVAPGLGVATLMETRVGFRPKGPDMKPMLGRVPGLDGLVIGNGLGASGLTIGPYAGRLLAEAALGRSPEVDLTPYDPLRG